MSRNNLTRDEARARAKLLRVAQYDVTLDLTGDERTFRSRTLTHFVCRKPGESTFIELTAPKVHRVELNGQPRSTRPRSSTATGSSSTACRRATS